MNEVDSAAMADSAAASRRVEGMRPRLRARGKASGAVVTTMSVLPRESQSRVLCQFAGSRSSPVGDHEPLPIVKTQLPAGARRG